MSSSLLLQQCPACLVRLTCKVFVMGGKCAYSWCLVGCCRQYLPNVIYYTYTYTNTKTQIHTDSVAQTRTVLLTSEFGSSTRGERHNS